MRYDATEVRMRIKELRKQRGETQEYLADAINLSWSMISKIECGVNTASIDILVDLAQHFEVSLDYLVLGKKTRSDEVRENLKVMRESFENLEKLL